MASLVDIVEHFTDKTSTLKQCMELRNAVHSTTCLSDLNAINKDITQIEEILSQLRETLETEKQNLDKAKALAEVVHHYKDHIQRISNHLPSHLPNSKREASNKAKPNGQEQPLVKRTKKTNSNEDTELPKIQYLTVDEFDTVPKYIKGRMNYQQLNAAVDEINKVLKAKYKILSLPRSAMGEPVMKKYKAFKEAETDETKGLYFFLEDDLKNFSNFKLDKAGRSVLTIMRHCSRVKELRSGGLIRYALK